MKDTELNLDSLRQKLLLLTYIYGYRRGNFVLSSGRSSTYYIDAKQVLMTPEGLHAMAVYILTSLQEQRVKADAIGGLTLGADPIAAAVCALGEISPRFHPLDCFIVRKEAKKHGTASRIEGPFQKGLSVVIVDDVLTTGASILNAAAAVEELDARVSAVYVLVDRREGGPETLQQAGYPLEAVLSRTDLEKLQRQMEGRFPALFKALQASRPHWRDVPWPELEARHSSLCGMVKDLGAQLDGISKQGRFDEETDQKAAQMVLTAIKAAELRPEGAAEAKKILQRVKKDFARP